MFVFRQDHALYPAKVFLVAKPVFDILSSYFIREPPGLMQASERGAAG